MHTNQTPGQLRSQPALVVQKLTTAYLDNPLGIDVRPPRLGWQVASSRRGTKQTAYQVQAAATPEHLKDEDHLL